jgi:hypothetical protein
MSRRQRGKKHPLRCDPRRPIGSRVYFLQRLARRLGILHRYHRPENIDQDIVHPLAADQPARRAQGRAGQGRLLFPKRIAHRQQRLGEALHVPLLEGGEQVRNARHDLRQRRQPPLRPVERTQTRQLPLASWKQRVIEFAPRLPPDLPKLPGASPCSPRAKIPRARKDAPAAPRVPWRGASSTATAAPSAASESGSRESPAPRPAPHAAPVEYGNRRCPGPVNDVRARRTCPCLL